MKEVKDCWVFMVGRVFSSLLWVFRCSSLLRELLVAGTVHSLYPFHSVNAGLKVHSLSSFSSYLD